MYPNIPNIKEVVTLQNDLKIWSSSAQIWNAKMQNYMAKKFFHV
jgi:hypothetical protein